MRPPHIITLCALSLAGCTANIWKPPQISYDELEPAVLEADPPKPIEIVEVPKLLPLPGQLKPMPGKATGAPEAKDPKDALPCQRFAETLRMTRGRCGSLILHRKRLALSTPCRSPGASHIGSASPPESRPRTDMPGPPLRAIAQSRCAPARCAGARAEGR